MAAKGHSAVKSKLLPVVVLILWFGAHGSSAQDGSVIIAIRAEVAQINGRLSTCTKTTKSVEGISLEGAEANYYSRGKELKKIAAKMYGETYNAAVELYYKDDMLTFAYYRIQPLRHANRHAEATKNRQLPEATILFFQRRARKSSARQNGGQSR